jgi:hypothetical protein
MSIEDDEYDLDDEVLDDAFEDDLEDDLDDFDEDDDGGMSFDEDEVLFTDDELEQHEAEDQELLGAEKKKFNLDIGFDKIAIFGAVIVGIIVLVFQVTTKTAEQRVEIFQSVLTMKGATDGEVFGERQVENIATASPEQQQEQKAFLYEPEALDRLPNNLQDGEIIGDTVISPVDPATMQDTSMEGEFFSNRERSEAAIVQRGEFVSATTGEVVEQDVRAAADPVLPRAQNIIRRPQVSEPEIINSQVDQIADRATPPSPQKPVSETEQEMLPENTPDKPIEQVKQRLNFVPIEQVAVKQEPAVPRVADRRVIEPVEEITEQTQRLQPLETSPQVAAQTQASKNELRALQREIEKLREEKTALEKQTAAMREEAARAVPSAPPVKVEEPTEDITKTPVAVPQTRDRAEKPVAKKVAPKARPKATTAPTLTNWQLRAAQPNKAWISKRGQRDMLAVTVGDTIQGLGRVVAITNRNGKWFVVGTDGQITQ